MENQGKEGEPHWNGKYQCPVDNYIYRPDVIDCLMKSKGNKVNCELDSDIDFY